MIHAGANIAGATILLLFVAFAWQMTGEFRRGSDFFPYIVLSLIGISAALWLGRTVVALRNGRAAAESEGTSLGSIGGYAVLAVTLIYGIVVVKTGYVIPSIIYLFVISLMLGGRRFVLISIVSVGFPFLIYYALAVGFSRPLPF